MYRLCMKEIMNTQVTEQKSEEAKTLFLQLRSELSPEFNCVFVPDGKQYLLSGKLFYEKNVDVDFGSLTTTVMKL